MQSHRYHPVFVVGLGWTLALLLLGSVVHATESSLACPDWPTCFGTMMPEMTGGVFYEHLHRLWAGGLLVIWLVGTVLAYRDGAPAWVRRAAVGGMALLLVQSVFGGLTVLYRLPDAVSTTHLGLAFLFLALATVMVVRGGTREPDGGRFAPGLVGSAAVGAGLVFLQSLIGAAVRHTDSGLACPDVPLCIGEWVPPLEQWPIALHFSHRVLAVIVSVWVLAMALQWTRALRGRTGAARTGIRLAWTAVVLVFVQVTLGILSVTQFLAVVPVSLHTLVAAMLLATLVAMAALSGGSAAEPGTPATKAAAVPAS